MVREIRLHLEGGGDKDNGKGRRAIREGFSRFFEPVKKTARKYGVKLNFIACGGRDSAYRKFKASLSSNNNALNLLLVDSEGPVDGDTVTHLATRDGWNFQGMDPVCFHLMVQTMEAWVLADKDALIDFYGNGLNCNPIPARQNIEEVPKRELETALREATRHCQKGEYHKLRHGPKILGKADFEKVRERAPHLNKLYETMRGLISSTA